MKSANQIWYLVQMNDVMNGACYVKPESKRLLDVEREKKKH